MSVKIQLKYREQLPRIVTFEWTAPGSTDPPFFFTTQDLKIKYVPGMGDMPVFVNPEFVKKRMGGGTFRVHNWMRNPYKADRFDFSVFDLDKEIFVQSESDCFLATETFKIREHSPGDIIVIDPRRGPEWVGLQILIFPPDVAARADISWP